MKITTLTLSLFAGFFSFCVSAGCLTRTGEIITSMDGTGSCPAQGQITFVLDDTDKCQAKPTNDWVCAETPTGWFGGPYVITGFLFDDNSGPGGPDDPDDPDDPNDPDDPDNPEIPSNPQLSDIRQNREYTGPETVNFSNAQLRSENSLITSTSVLFSNQNKLALDFISRLNKHDSDVKTGQAVVNSSVNSLAANVSSYFTKLDQSTTQLAEAVQQGGKDSPTKEDTAEILTAVQDVKSQVLSLLHNTDDQMTREAKHNELLNAAYYSSGDIQDIKDITSEIRRTLEDLPSGGSGGSGTDMSETNQKLDTINNTLQSNQMMLSGQLGAQLSDIKNAIENNSGGSGGSGGSDDDTETNEKLDGISDQLGNISDSLSGPYPDGSGSIQLSDYQTSLDEGYKQITDGINGRAQDVERITGMTNELKTFQSIPHFFRLAQSTCRPIDLGSASLDLCEYTPTIRTVLTWIFYILTVIFMVTSFHQTVQNMRL